jgi:hypothetical protein
MEYYPRNPPEPRIICRSETICCNDTERKSTAPGSMFPALCLRLGQITYDLHQLPEQALSSLRDSVISLLQTYSAGPRPIRTQLCVCLASLAIQITSWKNVLATIGPAISSSPDGQDAILDFLRILPEEVTEGRKINLTVCSTYHTSISGVQAAKGWPQITV